VLLTEEGEVRPHSTKHPAHQFIHGGIPTTTTANMAEGQPGKAQQGTHSQIGDWLAVGKQITNTSQFCGVSTSTHPTRQRPCSSPLRSPPRLPATSGNAGMSALLSSNHTPPRGADVHFFASRYQCFRLIGLQPLCAVIFTAGYALREYGSFNYLYTPGSRGSSVNLIVFILSQVFIYICP
jgi:hypothetical protein